MVDKVYKVTSRDTSRPILQGVLLSVEENTIRLVATDSYRLAVCDSNAETSSSDEAFVTIVPGSTFHDVLSLPSMTEQIMVGTTDSQVVFSFGNTTYVSRKIEGNFPNYRQLLPASFTTAVRLDAEQFGSALRRVSVIAASNPSVRFDADLAGKLMRLSASSPDQGESSELVDADVEGQDMSIALNFHYVFDCVNAVSGTDELTLELQGPMQPAIFKSYGTINYLYLLMPVRM
jgi:DNA polymerase-3 subunit beta